MEAAAQPHAIPAVVYAAKSTDDPRGSIDTQKADCEALCAREGLTVAESYSDEAKSAYHGSRGDGLVRAREHAERLAAERGECALVVQHTDRLARGDGVAAQHLVELLLWAGKARVRIRSVQDDTSGENLLMAAIMGERNHEDSKRKAAATAAGKRRAAERGESTGTVPDGYKVTKVADGTIVSRSVEQDPERKHVYRLIWDLAIDGMTVRSIVRELAKARCMTAPRKATPRPFDAVRVDKVLKCAFYAGLVVLRGEIVAPGKWVAYVEPDDWHRLQAERKARTRHRSEPVGRPAGGLLARLARCECGAAMVQQRGGPRKDGSRKRTYVCVTHMHRRDGCSATPYDAEIVESMVLGGLDELLGQAEVWSKALLAGREAERGRLTIEVDRAASEIADCEKAIDDLVGRYDQAVMDADESKIELAVRAMDKRKQAAKRAEARHSAARDALAAQETQPEGDADLALARLYEALTEGLDAAGGDVKALNGVLREHFDAMHLSMGDGQVSITPVLSAVEVEDLRRENDQAIATRVATRATDHQHWSYDRDPADPEHFILTPEAPVLASGQLGKQRPSHPAHNTRRGSSPGTADGDPRRNRRDGRRRRARFR
jgi:DNA invertase Pin-like site-specific DNA recombinase